MKPNKLKLLIVTTLGVLLAVQAGAAAYLFFHPEHCYRHSWDAFQQLFLLLDFMISLSLTCFFCALIIEGLRGKKGGSR